MAIGTVPRIRASVWGTLTSAARYRFGGRQMGYTGNNGTLDTDYQSSIDNRMRPQGTNPFRSGAPSAYADFDLSLDPITSYEQGSTTGSYTVVAGDTLSSIAAQLWGDSSLWYKLAEANGISGDAMLVEGQRLTIPAGVMKNTHNASTFKPYDPSEVLGDTSPTTPQPQKAHRNKCGVFGAVLLTVVAVAVSVLTYGALTAPAVAATATTAGTAGGILAGGGVINAVAAGAIAGAAGSVASQGFGLATGIQDRFSWKGVALAAIGGGVGGGLASAFPGGNILGAVARGAAGSAITQGIAVATGLQGKFDWAGVAAAGVIGGTSQAIGGNLRSLGDNNTLGNHLSHAGVGAASAIAGAATRSVLTGTDFGDNLIAVLPDVIGTTIGNAIGYGVSRGGAGAVAAHASATIQDSQGWDNESNTSLAAPGLGNGVAFGPNLGLGGGNYSDEAASAAAAGLMGALSGVSGGTAASAGFGVVNQYRFGSDPFSQWLATEFLKTGAPLDFDDYVAGGGVEWAAGMLWNEANSVAAGQLNNQLVILGNLEGRGSQYAGVVSQSLLSHMPSVEVDLLSAASIFSGSSNNHFAYISLSQSFSLRPMDLNAYSYQGRNYTRNTYPGPVLTNINTQPAGYRSTAQTMAYLDRVSGGTFGGIAYGFAAATGADSTTQDLAYNLGASLDGLALGRAVGPAPTRLNALSSKPGISLPLGPQDANLYWPPNQGFIGVGLPQRLPPGYLIDRFGFEGGNFVAAFGTPVPMRSLPPGTTAKPYNVYQVVRPFDVLGGQAAPYFGQPGRGVQFHLPMTVEQARHAGYLQRVWP